MTAADRRSRRGATLLEVVVAIVVLAVAGIGLVTLLTETGDALDTMLRRESTVRSASATLDRLALRSRAELMGAVGIRRERSFDLAVQQLSPVLFELAATDTLSRAVLLRTTLYRPEASRDTTR